MRPLPIQLLLKLSLFCLSCFFSANTFAYTEIPFCPGGGPPGWANYFNYKHNQNNWRQQYQRNAYYTPIKNVPMRYRQQAVQQSPMATRNIQRNNSQAVRPHQPHSINTRPSYRYPQPRYNNQHR